MLVKSSAVASTIGIVLLFLVVSAVEPSGVAYSTPKWWRVDSKLVFTELEGLSAVDSLHVWAAAGVTAQVTRSTDGGWNWSQTISGSPYRIDFIDTLRGWGLDPSYILRTTDGGQHWTTQTSAPGMSPRNLEFIDPLHGVVVGDSGFALFTSNGGVSWRKSRYPITKCSMFAIEVLDTSHVWVGGYSRFSDTSVVFFSSDWGQTWQSQPLQDVYKVSGVLAIDFLDTLNGFLFSRYGAQHYLYRTSNEGTAWNRILVLDDFSNFSLRDMDATDTLHIWMVGSFFPGEAAVLSTSDGGTSWDTTLTNYDGWFYNVEMFNNQLGWASGSEGLMYAYAELVRGDLNLDGDFSAADVVLELNKVFLGQPYPAPAPAGDVNCDTRFSPADVAYLLQRVFAGVPLPCPD